MTALASTALVAAFVNCGLGIYLVLGGRSMAQRLASAFTLNLACFFFSLFCMRRAPTPDEAVLWYRITGSAFLVVAAQFHLAWIWTRLGQHRLTAPLMTVNWTLAGALAAGQITGWLFESQIPRQVGEDWVMPGLNSSLRAYTAMGFVVVSQLMVIGLSLYHHLVRTRDTVERKNQRLVIFGLIAPAALALGTDIIPRLLSQPDLDAPMLAPIFYTLGPVIMIIGLSRIRLPTTLTPASYAQQIVDGLYEAVILTDTRGVIRSVNPSLTLMVGRPPELLIGQHINHLLAPEDALQREVLIQLMNERRTDGYERRLVGPEGERSVQLSYAPALDRRGVVVGIVFTALDVTDIRRTTLALRESRQHLAAVMEHTTAGIAITVDGRLVYTNRHFRVMSGREQISLEGRALVDLIHPEDQVRVTPDTGREDTLHTALHHEVRLIRRDGRVRWVDLMSGDIFHQGQAATLYTAIDITRRKLAEQTLQESESRNRRLAMVASLTINGVLITDRQGQIEWANEGFTRITGHTLEAVAGHHVSEVLQGTGVDPEAPSEVLQHIVQIEGFTEEFVSERADHTPYHLRLEGRPLPSERKSFRRGDFGGFMFLLTDVTEARKREDELRRARDLAQAATEAKSRFLATMSHELRTPMNGVIGMTSLLADTTLDPQQQEYVETARKSGEALLSLINDVLDFSKVEADAIELEAHPFSLADVVEETLDLLGSTAAAKGVDLLGLVAPTLPAMVVGDVTRLRQVLVNLISNAVKFTAEGAVILRIDQADTEPGLVGPVTLRCSVQDTGIGIPADRRERLFRPFSQVDASTTRRFGGTGLGLAISQRLVDLMGGTLAVDSEPGVGSLFHFTIKLDRADNALPEGVVQQFVGQRLLICHPNEVAHTALATHARRLGMLVIHDPGAADLVLWDERRGDQMCPSAAGLPQVLITDYPRMQGRPSRTVPLGRPIKGRSLQMALALALNPTPAPLPADKRLSPVPDLTPFQGDLRVLLAEDNPVNQRVALRFLDRMGLSADTVATGVEVLEAIRRQVYDVVLMDVQMPEMDGLEAARRINAEGGIAVPYIIALTANALDGDREACLEAGMHDYLSKPLRPGALRAALERGFHFIREETPLSQ